MTDTDKQNLIDKICNLFSKKTKNNSEFPICNNGDSTPEEMFGEKIKCSVCGFLGFGGFCQNCASPLDDPEDKIKWLAKGHDCVFKQEYVKAIECFDKHIELNSEDPLGYYFKGECLANLEKYEEALDLFGELAKTNPDFVKNDVNSNWRIGQTHFALGQYETGLSYVDRALDIMPEHIYAKQLKQEILKSIKNSD